MRTVDIKHILKKNTVTKLRAHQLRFLLHNLKFSHVQIIGKSWTKKLGWFGPKTTIYDQQASPHIDWYDAKKRIPNGDFLEMNYYMVGSISELLILNPHQPN